MKFRNRLRRWHLAMAGYRIYLLAFLLSLPDILDGLVGFDYASILPEGWGAKTAIFLSMARVVFGIYIRNLKTQNILSIQRAEELDRSNKL